MSANNMLDESALKFRYFFVGLTFAVLGLSIETVGLPVTTVGAVLEMIAWLMLLFAGVAGVSSVGLYPFHSALADIKRSVDAVRKEADGNREKLWSVMDEQEKIRHSLRIAEVSAQGAEADEIRRNLSFLPKLEGYQFWAFLLGILLLTLARLIDRIYVVFVA